MMHYPIRILKGFSSLCSLLFALSLAPCMAQPGANDETFNTTDTGFGTGDGPNAVVSTAAAQSDGKILIGGSFTSYNGVTRNRFARINANGLLDTSFAPQGATATTDFVSEIVIQSDGKILIVGRFASFNGVARNNIVRLNADGSIDAGFNPGTGSNNFVLTVRLQQDQKIVVGGSFTTFNGVARRSVARLNADGSLDTSFDPGNRVQGQGDGLAIQNDGKILVGASTLVRLNADGSADGTFTPGTGPNSEVKKIKLTADGKIYITGLFNAYNGVTRNLIARLNSDGTLDLSFNTGAGASPENISSINFLPNDKLLISGYFSSYNGVARNRLAILNADGTLDLGFDPGVGGVFDSVVAAILASPLSGGKILVYGQFSFYNGEAISQMALLNADGTLDANFNYGPGTGAKNYVYTSAVAADGKIIIGGVFSYYNNTPRGRIARLNADGTPDPTFTTGSGANKEVLSCALQSDGKVIIGGQFTSYNGTAQNYIARLNVDGSLDASFNPGTGANNTIRTVAVQPDGKILIGGTFTSVNGTNRNRIARLNADGSLDGSFTPAITGNIELFTISIQPGDGKIFAAGNFPSSVKNPVRLNTDGSLDQSFNVGTGVDNLIWTSTLQSDGKIIIGGGFTSYNGTTINRIARLNTDGTLDQSFNPGTGPSSLILDVDMEGDGKLIIGGEFISFNGDATKKYLARLNADGSIDPIFNIGTGPGQRVHTVSFQPDHKIIIGGLFTSYNGVGRNRIARINTVCDLSPIPVITEDFSDAEHPVLTSSYTSGNQWFLDGESIDGATSPTWTVDAPGIYTVEVFTNWCMGTSEPSTVIVTGTETAVGGSSAVFPNPATEKITLSLTGFEEGKPVSVQISDLYGRNIEKTAASGQQQLTVNVGSYASGIYWVLMQQNKTRVFTRFIKK